MPRIISLSVASRLLCVAFVLSLCGLSARACTTPVFRYALDNWSVAPYVVLYFYSGDIAEQDKGVNALLAELSEEEPPTNVLFYAIQKPEPKAPEAAEPEPEQEDGDGESEDDKKPAEEAQPLGENEMRFTHLPEFVKNMYWANVIPDISDIFGKAKSPIEIPLAKLLTVGEPLPALDDGRLEIAGPKRWSVPDEKDESDEKDEYVVRLQASRGDPYPAILVSAEDDKSAENITEGNVDGFVKKKAKALKKVLKKAGAKLTGKPVPLRVGDHWGIAYMTQVTETRKEEGEDEEIKDVIDHLCFETVVDGRSYTFELRMLDGTSSNVRLPFFAVIARTKFLKRDAVELAAPKEKPPGDTPFYLIVTPWQSELHAGPLDEKTVLAMIDSPARQKIGKLTAEGYASVLVVLECPDDEKNKKVAKVVEQIVAQIEEETKAEEEAEPETETPDAAKDAAEEEQPDDFWANEPEEAPEVPFRVATLNISQTDPAEKWLVRSLLAIEPDLNELTDSPMIFAVYGRGRAMPPYVGKGITAENVLDCMMFLSGPCSCQVKDMNPGMDLLMKWDWEATAEAVAEAAWEAQEGTQEGQQEGENLGYEEVAVATTENPPEETTPEEATPEEATPEEATPEEATPEETTPEETTPEETTPAKPAEKPEKPKEPTPGEKLAAVFGQPPGDTPKIPSANSAKEAPSPKTPPVNSAEGPLSPEAEAAADSIDELDGSVQSTAQSFAFAQIWKIGIGLVIALVVVIAIGFAMIRH